MGGLTIEEALRRVPMFSGLPQDRLAWVSGRGYEVRLDAGAGIAAEGDPADGFYVILEGQTEWTRRVAGRDVFVVTLGEGEIFAELILLLDSPYVTSGRAVTAVRMHKLDPEAFWEMLAVCPQVLRDILAVAAERSQLHESVSQQQARLSSLSSLAAGLAHELNNPAAAIRRGARDLREVVSTSSARAFELGRRNLDDEQRRFLAELPASIVEKSRGAPDLDPLRRGDGEDEISAWLEQHGVENAWDLSPTFLDAGLDSAWLQKLTDCVGTENVGAVVYWLEAQLHGIELVEEVEQSAARISALVGSVREYSYMDRAPLQDVDLNDALDSTLAILAHRLEGLEVSRDYDAELPTVCAYGSELNQAWTNLISNAADAMEGGGRLQIKTRKEGVDRVSVEITDDGPGIPAEARERIFEPFFTTKGVGEGTGLGLDIVRRVVSVRHGGDIRVESEPGQTRFVVRLPVEASEADRGNGRQTGEVAS